MIKLIQYFKTAKGRTNLKWGLVVLVLVIVVIYLFRRVNDSGSNNPLVKQNKQLIDSLTSAISYKDKQIEIFKQNNDSLIVALGSKEVLIQEKTKYVEKEVIRYVNASVTELQDFFPARFDRPHQ